MATKRITGGFRGFSTAKEVTFGVPAVVDTAFNFEGDPTDIEINESQDDGEEVTGLNEPSAFDILNYKLEGSHQQRANPHNIAQFAGMCLGKVTTDQPDSGNNPEVYQHWFERDLDNSQLSSFTLVENDGVATKQFAGIFGKTLKLLGERGDFLKMECGFGGMGKEETSAVVKPTILPDIYLRYGDVNFSRGGSITGSVAGQDLVVGGGPTVLNSVLRSFEWNLDNQAETIYAMGDSSGLVTLPERGDKFLNTLSAEFEMQDDQHKAALIAGTEYVLNISIVGAPITGSGADGLLNYTVDLIFPKVVYKAAKKGRDGEKMIVPTEFMVLEDVTYGSVIVKVINKQAAYLT